MLITLKDISAPLVSLKTNLYSSYSTHIG